MNLGVTLKAAEKVFGPALPGRGTENNTLSAVRYIKGRSTKYAGIAGMKEDAKFYIHFPTPIDWTLLTTKSGTPDFVSELKESGPQGEQGREELAAAFLEKQEAVREKIRQKFEAAEKKSLAKKRKDEAVQFRQRLASYAGEREALLTIGSDSIPLLFKITVDKTGKVKIVSTV